MKPNGGLIAAGFFFIFVVAGIAFLLLQDGGEYPGALPEQAARTVDATPEDNASTAIDAPAISQGTPSNSDTGTPQEAGTPNAVAPVESPNANTPQPRGPGIVTGVVTWHDGGAPVSGAQVVLRYMHREPDAPPDPDNVHRWTATTDAQGEFRVANLPVTAEGSAAYSPIVVTASKDGASATDAAVLSDTDALASLALTLRPSGGISGQVVDGQGAPIAGAIVRPHAMEDATLMEVYYPVTFQWSNTDEDGRFHVEHVSEGEWRLAASSDHFAQAISAPFQTGESNAKIVMAPGASVSGIVVDAGSGDPVPDIGVFAIGEESFQTLRRVESGADGAFRVDALPDGNYRIYIDDETRVLAGAPPRAVIANALPVDGVTVKVTQGGVVSGTVRDAETGAPISGVRLKAWFDGDYFGPNLDATSDANGAYRITGLPPGRCTVNRLPKEGYVTGRRDDRTVPLALGQVLEKIDFVLSRGVNLSGTVRDEAGDPVAGVEVVAELATIDRESGSTGEGGAFTVRGLPPNTSVTIGISGRGYTSSKMPPVNTGDSGVTDLEIVVEMGASIAGVVVDAKGKPAPEVMVTAALSEFEDIASEFTGPDGEFVLAGLPPGTYRVEASALSGVSRGGESSQTITLAKGEKVTGIRLVLGGAPESTITGKITNTKGEPLASASVNANSFMSDSHAFAESDAGGNYELAAESGGLYQIDVYHMDYSDQGREDVAAGSSDVDFVLEGRGAVEGQVLDAATGKPIAQFEIAHTSGFSSPSYFQADDYIPYFDETGRFRVDDVDAGEATIFVRAQGYGPGHEQVAEVRPGEVTADVVFRLQAGASIAGLVRDSKGAPVQGARIYLASAMELWLIEMDGQDAIATSDDGGRFTINSLGEGPTAITAAHPDYSRTTVEVDLTPGQTGQVEIVMATGGTVTGLVTANGAPAADQDVFVHTDNMADLQSATTDAGGRYTLSGIAPGEVNVNASVTLGDASRTESKIALVESGATTTLDFNVEFGAGAIEGTLLDGGVPVSDAYISAVIVDAAAGLAQNIGGTVSSGGAYRISGLDAGVYKVMVNVGVFGENDEKSRTVDVTLSEGETVHLDIDLSAGAQVRGIVSGVTETGMCMVFAFKGTHQITDMESAMGAPEMQNHMAGTSSTDAAGAYTIGGLEAGDYTVMVFQIDPDSADDDPDGTSMATGHVTLGESGVAELDLALP